MSNPFGQEVRKMRYIVMAYSSEGCQEFILPTIDNADYEILLEKRRFNLSKNLAVHLEIIDGNWSFSGEHEYYLRGQDGSIGCKKVLKEGQIFYLKDTGNVQLTLVILECQHAFPTFRKFLLDGKEQFSVGKSKDNEICYDFWGYISRKHVIFSQHKTGWIVKDVSRNGGYLNGIRIKESAFLNFGDQIAIFGLKLVFLEHYLAVCVLTGDCQIKEEYLPAYYPREQLCFPLEKPKEEKQQYFKRAPRMIEPLYTEPFEIEALPQMTKVKKKPLYLTIGPGLTMAVPMLLSSLMTMFVAANQGEKNNAYMYTGVITAIASAALGTVWALANYNYTEKEVRENEMVLYQAYEEYLEDMEKEILQKYNKNKEILYQTFLSGSECCAFDKWDTRFWNHNDKQPDFLTVRLGIGTIPFQAKIQIPKERFSLIKKDDLLKRPAYLQERFWQIDSAPVCINIREKGLLGIIGGNGKMRAYAVSKNIIAQLAANNCYTDLKLAFIYEDNPEHEEMWSFARWLPHVWLEDRKFRLIAGNKLEIGDICYELSQILHQRTDEANQKKRYPLPHFVLFVDDRKLLQGEILERYLYHPKPEYGITTILLAERYEELPNSCEEILQNDGRQSEYFHVYNHEKRSQDLVFETVSGEELDQLSRRLCDMEVNKIAGAGEIPESLDFFTMYGVHTPDELNVLERWKKHRNYENMRVPIGQQAGGKWCCLDIHEKYHGPHGLIAGTTGSGKSETLQTYILSLAVNFSPDDIAFFMIDFKGGGMANLFHDLPHLAGQISNLSGSQVQRAMISIKSENQRRQRIFAKHHVNNINLYTRLYKNHETDEPIPHLLIIIDEFAELKREEPEFMKELISIAQVGRSLGIHLILATQKPSGTVDENIWSNSRFRLCLRVQDKQDSNDMLHKPDAAHITRTGRGYLQVGSDEIYEQFQTGFSGAKYVNDPKERRGTLAVRLSRSGKPIMPDSGIRAQQLSSGESRTQLEVIVTYLSELAEKHHYTHSRMLWLPVLPSELYLETVYKYAKDDWKVKKAEGWKLEAFIGLYDDPENQAQKPLKISFSEGGHLAICGTVATGKSTLLQTLLYALLNQYSPEELNVYILDYSSRMLMPFESAPHCGGVILDTDVEKVKRFFHMLGRMMDDRKYLLGGGNYTQYIRKHPNQTELPAILVVIDHYSGFREKTDSQFDEEILKLSREGVGYGIFLAVSSAGLGANELPTKIGDNIRTIISLEMGDKFKYAEALKCTRVEILPQTGVKGRGLAYVEGKILEFQTALAVCAEDAYERLHEIQDCCETLSTTWTRRRAKQIPVIPKHPVMEEFSMLETYKKAAKSKRYLPIGYLEQDASLYCVNLWNTYCWIIQGNRQSGKKNVLKILLYGATKKPDAKIYLIDPERKIRKDKPEYENIICLSDEQEIYEFFQETIPIFRKRNQKKQALLNKGIEAENLAEQMNQETQFFIFIADLSSFIQMVYKPSEGIGSIRAYLENISEKGSLHGFYFFGILNPEQGMSVSGYRLYQNMVSSCSGIHLGGNVSGQRLFRFGNIPFQEQTLPSKVGTGLVPCADDPRIAQKIVLPMVKGGYL